MLQKYCLLLFNTSQIQTYPEAKVLINTVAPKGENSKASGGACSFRVAQCMPLIRAACYSNPGFDGLEKAQFFSAVLGN